MDRLRRMPAPTRNDLEAAAAAYFELLLSEADRPRNFDDERFDDHVARNVELSGDRIGQLEDPRAPF